MASKMGPKQGIKRKGAPEKRAEEMPSSSDESEFEYEEYEDEEEDDDDADGEEESDSDYEPESDGNSSVDMSEIGDDVRN